MCRFHLPSDSPEIKRIITMQMQIYTNIKRVCDKKNDDGRTMSAGLESTL